jgi:hypothetical protein
MSASDVIKWYRLGQLGDEGPHMQISVTQEGNSCSVTVSTTNMNSVGGTEYVYVSTEDRVEWTAESKVNWITFAQTSGKGSGTVEFEIAKNISDSSRQGDVVVAWTTFTINQNGQVLSTIEYRNDLGATHDNPTVYAEGDSFEFQAPMPLAGYTFLGWQPSGIFESDRGPVTVIGQWTTNEYTVHFDPAGGAGQMTDQLFVYNQLQNLNNNDFSWRGHEFLGWSIGESGEGAIDFRDGAIVSNLTDEASATVILHAVWKEYEVDAPQVSPGNGHVFKTDSCMVTLSCATPKAKIYYTTDGTTPKITETYRYVFPFDVQNSATIKAVAEWDGVKSGYVTSRIVKLDTEESASICFSPTNGSSFSGDLCDVSIECDIADAAIYYTTNGTLPMLTSDFLYQGPFPIEDSCCVTAVAVTGDGATNAWATALISRLPLTLEEALGIPDCVTVETGGDASWYPLRDSTSPQGKHSAKSGLNPGDDGKESWLQVSANGAGCFTFFCKTSCEHDEDGALSWDCLRIETNGTEVTGMRMDGETDWVEKSIIFARGGVNRVRWIYRKDRDGFAGEDCAWISGVKWNPYEAFPNLGDNPTFKDVLAILVEATDGRLAERIGSVEEYETFRVWIAEKGLEGTEVKHSAQAWPSFALRAERLFEGVPEIRLRGIEVGRNGAKAVGGATMRVSVTVRDGGKSVAVDAEKVAALFECTSDVSDWTGEAAMEATATPTGEEGDTLRFEVVPADGAAERAFLRIGE